MNTLSTTQKSTPTRISPEAAHSKLSSALFLDVRTPAEFGEAHIDSSTLMPLQELDPEKVKSLAQEHSSCVVICRSGNRASQAAQKLAAAGLSSIEILDGGLLAWEAAGLPVKRGAKRMSLERQVRIAAGALVFTGSSLAWFVHPAWIALPAFVGAGLVFAGITDTCGMGMLIARMPWNQKR